MSALTALVGFLKELFLTVKTAVFYFQEASEEIVFIRKSHMDITSSFNEGFCFFGVFLDLDRAFNFALLAKFFVKADKLLKSFETLPVRSLLYSLPSYSWSSPSFGLALPRRVFYFLSSPLA